MKRRSDCEQDKWLSVFQLKNANTFLQKEKCHSCLLLFLTCLSCFFWHFWQKKRFILFSLSISSSTPLKAMAMSVRQLKHSETYCFRMTVTQFQKSHALFLRRGQVRRHMQMCAFISWTWGERELTIRFRCQGVKSVSALWREPEYSAPWVTSCSNIM